MHKFTVDLSLSLDRWGAEKQAEISARRESGRTSIRVSKSTLQALRAFARQLRDVAIAEGAQDSYRLVEPSPDALLAALASGTIRVDVDGKACPRPRPRKGHASKRSGKGMPRAIVKGMPASSRR